MTSPIASTVIEGRGETQQPLMARFDPRARSTVRYADPAAWIVASAVSFAIEGLTELVDHCSSIGVVTVSSCGPQVAMAEVEEGGRSAFSSPLRYAASSPGSLVGVSCIAFGLRGPTLNITMSLEEGLPVAAFLCSLWLDRGIASKMILATYMNTAKNEGLGRAVLLSAGDASASGTLFDSSVVEWLGCVTTGDGVKS